MKKRLIIGLIISFMFTMSFSTVALGDFDYGDISLDQWESGNMPEVWDLTRCDLTLSYTIDLSGQVTGGWTPVQVGLRDLGSPNLDPNYQGGWMQANWDGSATNPSSADLDDHLLLVDHGWASDELNYDVDEVGDIVTPFGSYNSYAFWFDRDGVDATQATFWNYKDGVTYNTVGVYDLSVTYHAVDSDTGTMVASINGEDQGFYDPSYSSTNPPDRTPVGRSFAADMSQLQLFYGRGGGGGTVELTNISVDGCLYDKTAPLVNISSPLDGANLLGLVDIVGSVTDNIELSHYNLSLYPASTDLSDGNTHSGDRLNDGNWCTTPTSGTVYLTDDIVDGNLCTNWDTTAYADGDYQIRLAARDAAGNRDISDPYNGNTSSVHVIGITIDNTLDSKEECKNGGWEYFGFKNQGQCVRFIETGKDSR